MPNGSRESVTVRATRSWIAIAYMPRRWRTYSALSRRNRCSGGSQSLSVWNGESGSSARNSL